LELRLLAVVLHRLAIVGPYPNASRDLRGVFEDITVVRFRFLGRRTYSQGLAIEATVYFPVLVALSALLFTSPFPSKTSTTNRERCVRLKQSRSPTRRSWSCENARQPEWIIGLSDALTLHVFPLGPSSVIKLPAWNVSGCCRMNGVGTHCHDAFTYVHNGKLDYTMVSILWIQLVKQMQKSSECKASIEQRRLGYQDRGT
jgi:hypothetical protein